MEGERPETPWGAVPRKKRSNLQQKKRVYDQGKVAEETTPEWLLKQMKKEEYEGYDANQIMELKELKPTDLNKSQGRLLLLPKHIDRCFLNEGERETLAAVPIKGVSSLFIDTDGEEYDLELREWTNGLVLTKGWGNVIVKDVFKIGEKYPLWCFRSRNKNNKLCFALVKTNQVEQALPNVDNNDEKLSAPNDTEEVAHESSSFRYLEDDDLAFPTLADQLKGFDDYEDLALPTVAYQFKGFDDDDDLPLPTGFDDVPDLAAFFRDD